MRYLLTLLALVPACGQAPRALLFYASLRQSAVAEYAAGDPAPLQSQGVNFDDAAILPPGARLAYDARANLYAEQGTVSFWWRPEATPGRVSFPLLLVSYEQHSTWDFNFMRIWWSGSDLSARVTDRNYVTHSVRAAVKPEAGQWLHIALSWSESDGLAFYVNGKLASRLSRPLELDARLDQFGLLTAAVTPHHTSGNENAGAVRELRIYRVPLDSEDVGRVAASEEPLGDQRRPVRWAARFGWLEGAGIPAGAAFKVTRLPIVEAKDLGKFWLKGADGKRETFWPMISHGYADEGKTYRIRTAGQPFNLVRTTGNLAGRITLGEASYERPATELHYYSLPEPRAIETIVVERRAGVLAELACLRVEKQSEPPGDGWMSFTPVNDGRFRDRRDPETYTVWEPGPARPGPGGRRYNYFLLPLGAGTALAGVRLRWQATPGAYYYVGVGDPINVARNLIEFDLQAQASAVDLTLAFPGLVVGSETNLAVVLASSSEEAPQMEAKLILAEAEEARRQHVAERVLQVRDSFQMLSEARPWMQISRQLPATVLRGQLKLLDELYVLMEDLRRLDPAHPVGVAYWSWVNRLEPPPPFEEPPPQDPSIPLWAHRQLALLKQFRQVVDWWITHRQIETGEMGGGLGDDTDMIQNWPAVALMDGPADHIRDSARRVLEACYAQGMIVDGLNRMRTDPLHAYEEGMNAYGPVFLLDYGNPVIFERMMQTAIHYSRLTGINRAGHRHFRSYLYSATDMVEEGYYGREDIYSHLILHPGLYVAWYNRNPIVVQLLEEFATSLLAHWQSEKYPNLARTIFFADDRVTQRAAPASETFNLFWGLYEITGEPRYLWLLRQAVDASDFSRAAYTNAWWLDLFPSLREALVLEGQRRNIRDHNLQTDQVGLVARVLAWQATGDLQWLEEAQAALVQHMAQNMYLYTEAEQFTDRIWIPTLSVQRERLGGVAHYRNYIYPGHAVSWDNTAGEVAALVTATRGDYLSLLVFNAGLAPRKVRLRVWRLENGRYEATLRDEQGSTIWQARLSLKRFAPVDLELPPRQLLMLEIRQLERGTPLHQLPDLAIAAEELGGEQALEVPVHNIGAAPSRPFVVKVFDEAGRLLAEAAHPSLEAPVDLKPRMARISFPGIKARPGLQVVVQQENSAEEITDHNNRAVLNAGR